MALKISKNSDLTDTVTPGNPISTEHPITGSTVEVRLFLYNDDSTKRYENPTIDSTDTTGSDESAYVQLAPDNVGSAGTYLAGGAALTLANIADSNVAKPFWAKITMPTVVDTANKTDIKLNVTGKEYAV